MFNATYSEYPHFQARLSELAVEREEQIRPVLARFDAGVTDDEAHALKQQCDQIDAAYDQGVEEARKALGVPVLQAWQAALAKTGNALFHQETMLYEGQSQQATVTKDAAGRITLIFQETYTFPPSMFPTLDKIDSHLTYRGLFGNTWEAIAKTQMEDGKANAQS